VINRCLAFGFVCLSIFKAVAVEPTRLSFDDLLLRPIGPYGIEIGPKAKNMQGQIVQLRGFMVKSEDHKSGQFYLSPMPIQLNEHADGLANDLPASAVLVKFDPSQSSWMASHQPGSILLEGILHIGRHEDTQGNVSWFQLLLPIY
jgi:hypothetical protein